MGPLAVSAFALGLALASAAAAGPIRVRIEAEPAPRDPFLVSVTGHYADLHNGHSRRWKHELVRAGGGRWIALGPVMPLLNMGVSVSLYHPEFVGARERSRKTPLLVRPVLFDTFRPQPWRAMLDSGGVFENGGPEYGLGQVVGHLQAFLLSYLPALDDAAGEPPASEASLRGYLPLFEELVRFAESDAAASRRSAWVARQIAGDPGFARAMAKQDTEQRAEARALLQRSRAWLSLPRRERVHVRTLMEAMRYRKTVAEELMTASDRSRLGAFLDRYRAEREDRRSPERATAWSNPKNRVTYRVRILDPPRQCAYLAITVDLTGVVAADLGEMTRSVRARFCRRPSGEWRHGLP